ncbi:MAG: hypothetical protein E7468_06635 [Ruminococcaceae bacterium]|nr:hypothetical protein [Oscillospiraceae bacterium]
MEITSILEALEEGVLSMNFTTGGVAVLVYILKALALYTIAKRRNIKKPWLAWIPVVNVWILGSVSDQYQYVVKRQVKNKRKVLLGLNIAMAAIGSVVLIAAVWLFAVLLLTIISVPTMSDPETLVSNLMYYAGTNVVLLNLIGLAGILAIPLAVVSVIQTVYFYMALYDVFRSCEPKNSTLYLVLSLVGNVVVDGAYCIFLMLCKDKDLGMPPRKPEIVEEIPGNTEE